MAGSTRPMMLVAMVIIATALFSLVSGTSVPRIKSAVNKTESSRITETSDVEGTKMATEDSSPTQNPLPTSTGVSKMADDTNVTTVSPSPTAGPASTIPSSTSTPLSPWEETQILESSTQNPSHDAMGAPTAPEESPTANQSELSTYLNLTKMTIHTLPQEVDLKGADNKTNSTQKPRRPEGAPTMATTTRSKMATLTSTPGEQTKMAPVSSTHKPLSDGGSSPKMAAATTVATGSPSPVGKGKAKRLSTTMPTTPSTTGSHLGGMSLRPTPVTAGVTWASPHAARSASWVLPVVVVVVLLALVLLAAALCWRRQQRSGSTSFAGQQWAGPVPLPEEGGAGGGAEQGAELQAGVGLEPGPALSTFKGRSPSAEVAMQELPPATSEVGPAEEATPLLGTANGSTAPMPDGDGGLPAPPPVEAPPPVQAPLLV